MLRDIRSGSLDLAALALWPYAVGFVVTVIYYSRFRIFSVGLLSPHYILLGLYVIVLYAGLPFLVFRLSAELPKRWQIATSIPIFIGANLLLLSFLRLFEASPGLSTSLHLAVLQFALFFKPLRTIDLSGSLGTLRLMTVLLLASAHFAFFFVGNIPQFLGGAKPVDVLVLPVDEAIFRSRFIRSATSPATGERRLFKLQLLFESADDFFFLRVHNATIEVNGESIGGSRPIADVVIRVPKRLVDKLEYSTPHAISFEVKGASP